MITISQRLLSGAALIALLAQPLPAQTWNAASDFTTTQNPNGVWTYGWMDTGFTSFTAYSAVNTNANGSPMWGQAPEIWKNVTGVTSYGVPNGSLSFHPGPGTEPSVLRWTAPGGFSGTVDIVGQFLPGDQGSMEVAIRQGGSVLWSATDSGAFSFNDLGLSAGEFVDFAVYGGYSYGNTGLDLTITGSAIPEPSTYAALLGLAVMAWAWHRRNESRSTACPRA